MKKMSRTFSTLGVLIFAVFAPALAGEGLPAPDSARPESLFLVREAWVVFVEEPSAYLHEAYSAFLGNETEAAQESLRKAGVFLFMQARWADDAVRQELEESLKDLNGLIAGLDGESNLRAADFREGFARAEYRLALAHLAFAAELVGQKSYGTAGYALDAAAAHLLAATLWFDGTLPPEELLKARRARSLAESLRAGAEGALKDVREALKNVAGGIRSLAGQLDLAPAMLPANLEEE